MSGVDRDLGKLLYTLATKLPKQFHGHLPILTSYLASRKIDQEPKLNAAMKFVQVCVEIIIIIIIDIINNLQRHSN